MSELDRALHENPRKRVKRESPSPSPSPSRDADADGDADMGDEKPFQNHPTFYLDDGNIILRTGGTLFCVHRSLLSMHSSVFRERFRHEDERFRGLPHYTMEETREDLEVLLKVIYEGLHVDVKQLTVETWPTLATVLRMASKYKIERPCAAIVARIRTQWPATLAEHDALLADVRPPVSQPLAIDDKGKGKGKGKAPEAAQGPANLNGNGNGNGNGGGFHTNSTVQLTPAAFAQFQAQFQPQPQPQNMPWGGPAPMGNIPPPPGPATFNRRGGPMSFMGGPQFQPGGQQIPPQTFYAHPNNRPLGMNMNANNLPLNRVLPNPFAQGQVAGPSNANLAGPGPAPAPAHGPAGGGGGGGGGVPGAAAAPAAPPPKEDLIIHPASVIAVLRECNYRDADLLFPLFYALSRTTAQFGGAALGHHLAPLGAADMERFVVGIERLRAEHTALAVSTPAFDFDLDFGHANANGGGNANANGGRGTPQLCRAGAQQLWTVVGHTMLVTNAQHPHEPLEEWRDMVASVEAQHASYAVCAECCKAIVAQIQTYRASLWASLLGFFELA